MSSCEYFFLEAPAAAAEMLLMLLKLDAVLELPLLLELLADVLLLALVPLLLLLLLLLVLPEEMELALDIRFCCCCGGGRDAVVDACMCLTLRKEADPELEEDVGAEPILMTCSLSEMTLLAEEDDARFLVGFIKRSKPMLISPWSILYNPVDKL